MKVKIGSTLAADEKKAVQELGDALYQLPLEGGIFFCSSRYDLDRLGAELKNRFSCPLVGCTTAGEISPLGYQEGGIVGVSFSSAHLKMNSYLIRPLSEFTLRDAQVLGGKIGSEVSPAKEFAKERLFGFVLMDGLSVNQEQALAWLYHACEGIPLVGGSAADDFRFAETKVYWDGAFVSDAALFTVVATTLPFHTFKTQHFVPTDKKLVITAARPEKRTVSEINAEPAAEEYARTIGVAPEELNPTVFSQYPLTIRIGDEWYVRSIQKANEDGSLSFFCAIDTGLVLTLARGADFLTNLAGALRQAMAAVPHPGLILGCDCGLRKLEILETEIQKDVERVLEGTPFVGFSTYGEQFNAIHVNHTLTGIVIGERP